MQLVVLPLALVDLDAVQRQDATTVTHVLAELALVDAAVLVDCAASAPALTVPAAAFVLHLISS